MMTHDDSKGIGNTFDAIPSLRCRKWFFTWNNYTRGDIDSLISYFKDAIYKFQEEEGIASKIKHLQGCVEFPSQRSFQALKINFPKLIGKKLAILKLLLAYCCKEETRAGKVFESKANNNCKSYNTRSYDELYDWQKKVLAVIDEEPDDRTIYWFWEPDGCAGKTTLVKYILKHYSKATYSCANKSADILSIADIEKNIYMLNFSRNQEGYCPWSAL